MAEHTPLPWSCGLQWIFTSTGYPLPIASGYQPFVTEKGGREHDKAVANAAHIVKCVNSHDALVEALEKARVWVYAASITSKMHDDKKFAAEDLAMINDALENAKAGVGVDASVLQDDLREMLQSLGMNDGAQAKSPHQVFQEALVEMKRRLTAPSANEAKIASLVGALVKAKTCLLDGCLPWVRHNGPREGTTHGRIDETVAAIDAALASAQRVEGE